MLSIHLKSITGMRTVNVALCALCVALHRLSVPVYDHPFTLNKINYVFIENSQTQAKVVISNESELNLMLFELALLPISQFYRML